MRFDFPGRFKWLAALALRSPPWGRAAGLSLVRAQSRAQLPHQEGWAQDRCARRRSRVALAVFLLQFESHRPKIPRRSWRLWILKSKWFWKQRLSGSMLIRLKLLNAFWCLYDYDFCLVVADTWNYHLRLFWGVACSHCCFAGQTPLHVALFFKHNEAARVLISAGAKVAGGLLPPMHRASHADNAEGWGGAVGLFCLRKSFDFYSRIQQQNNSNTTTAATATTATTAARTTRSPRWNKNKQQQTSTSKNMQEQVRPSKNNNEKQWANNNTQQPATNNQQQEPPTTANKKNQQQPTTANNSQQQPPTGTNNQQQTTTTNNHQQKPISTNNSQQQPATNKNQQQPTISSNDQQQPSTTNDNNHKHQKRLYRDSQSSSNKRRQSRDKRNSKRWRQQYPRKKKNR